VNSDNIKNGSNTWGKTSK